MRMLASQATALQYLLRNNILSRLVIAEVASLTLVETPRNRTSMRAAVYNSIIEEIKAHVTESKVLPQSAANKAEKWFKETWNEKHVASEAACHIHAEAGLMALACQVQSGPPSDKCNDPQHKYTAALKASTRVLPYSCTV